jgi:vancomycin resistance protein YoaR
MKKMLLGGLIVITALMVLGAFGTAGIHNDTINQKNAVVATAQHEQAVANARLTAAQQAAARAKTDEAAAAAGQTAVDTTDMNPLVKAGLKAAWDGQTSDNQSAICTAMDTNANDVAQAATNGVPAQDKGIVTTAQVLVFYQNACSAIFQ